MEDRRSLSVSPFLRELIHLDPFNDTLPLITDAFLSENHPDDRFLRAQPSWCHRLNGPTSNHPEKFLQLDVGMLPATHGMFQVGAVVSSQRHWQNRVYSQRERRSKTDSRSSSPEKSPVLFVDRYLERHITPVTLKTNIKRNPLFMDISRVDARDNEKSKPSWTVQDYDTQTAHGNLTNYLKKDMKTAKDLDFWLEDLYTPGFDSLLKKKQAEHRKKRLCKIIMLITFSVCVVLVVVIVPVVVLKQNV